MFMCVRVCVCVCVCARVRACVCVNADEPTCACFIHAYNYKALWPSSWNIGAVRVDWHRTLASRGSATRETPAYVMRAGGSIDGAEG